jgi:hypothetical protein
VSKFKNGDRISIISSKRAGTIIDVDYDHDSQESEYRIIWDDMPGSSGLLYNSKYADQRWEFIGVISTINGGIESCAHEWREYFGFNESYSFCRRCDAKKAFDE